MQSAYKSKWFNCSGNFCHLAVKLEKSMNTCRMLQTMSLCLMSHLKWLTVKPTKWWQSHLVLILGWGSGRRSQIHSWLQSLRKQRVRRPSPKDFELQSILICVCCTLKTLGIRMSAFIWYTCKALYQTNRSVGELPWYVLWDSSSNN